ncbi:MAG TPA: hypothetical protein VHC19_02845 [Pirellulales bacterium]|jgi:hypothetical protein|nr:hypothetical protein [Pirellulales bacterium]
MKTKRITISSSALGLGVISLCGEIVSTLVMAVGVERLEPLAVTLAFFSPIAVMLAFVAAAGGCKHAWIAVFIGVMATCWLVMASYACIEEETGPLFRWAEAVGLLRSP